jgi:hypothetical protein
MGCGEIARDEVGSLIGRDFADVDFHSSDGEKRHFFDLSSVGEKGGRPPSVCVNGLGRHAGLSKQIQGTLTGIFTQPGQSFINGPCPTTRMA